jgi:hypothetical protein
MATHDISALISFSHANPYHPAAALTLCELCESQGQFSDAVAFALRALYAFESSVPPAQLLFPAAAGSAQPPPPLFFSSNVRMDAALSLNSVFFRAIFKCAQLLGKKGAARMACELLKLLLSFAPLADPMCALQVIDYYAMRARSFAFLLQLATALDAPIHASSLQPSPWSRLGQPPVPPRQEAPSTEAPPAASEARHRVPCSYLPNFLYSCALAQYQLERSSGAASTESAAVPELPPHPLPFPAPSFASLPSSTMLHHAILLFPEAVPRLLAACASDRLLQIGAEGSAAAAKLARMHALTPYADKLMNVYVERSALLWKPFAGWLATETLGVLRALAAAPPGFLAPFAALRSALFSSRMPRSLAALQKAQYSDEVQRIDPALLMGGGGGAADVWERLRFPPLESLGLRPLDMRAHPLVLFFRSFLPWNVLPEPILRRWAVEDLRRQHERGEIDIHALDAQQQHD